MANPGRIAFSLDPASDLPTDVKFVFKNDDDGTCTIKEEVKAHKLILAIASDVFKRQFFGSMQSENIVNILDANKDVFQTMIDYVYNKKIEFLDYGLDYLSHLYHLADKYDIEELRLEIIASIPAHEITIQNVIDVAILAEENTHHQALSEALYDVAATFLRQKFDDKARNVYKFFSEAEASERHGLVLMKVVGRINFLLNLECDNCKQVKESCLNGQPVKCDTGVVGAKVYSYSHGRNATIIATFVHYKCPTNSCTKVLDIGSANVNSCIFKCV